MKIITLNIDGNNNIAARLDSIVDFLNRENPDIVCLQEVCFHGEDNLANVINRRLALPYQAIQADLAEEYEQDGRQQTDGLAILTRQPITRRDVLTLTKAPDDGKGQQDLHKRIAQFIMLQDGTVICNTRLAPNDNAYQQFRELIKKAPEETIFVGDFNIPKEKMLAESQNYGNSIKNSNYISSPSTNQALDYIITPNGIMISGTFVATGLSDHNAVVCGTIGKYFKPLTPAKLKIAAILGILFGFVGVHNFLQHQRIRGILHIFFCLVGTGIDLVIGIVMIFDAFKCGTYHMCASINIPEITFVIISLSTVIISWIVGIIESIYLLATTSKRK